jgi:hypothetical protein
MFGIEASKASILKTTSKINKIKVKIVIQNINVVLLFMVLSEQSEL